MNRKDFETLVAEGYEQLPQWVREKIKNVKSQRRHPLDRGAFAELVK